MRVHVVVHRRSDGQRAGGRRGRAPWSAAPPPLTPSRMRAIDQLSSRRDYREQPLERRLRSAVVVLQLAGSDLLEGDREVVFRRRLDHRGWKLIEGSLPEVV